jgi:hypothetical protein
MFIFKKETLQNPEGNPISLFLEQPKEFVNPLQQPLPQDPKIDA